MMHVSVNYQDERLELEIPEERVVASWSGPAGMDRLDEIAAIRDALEQPWDFPPLRQMLVPGDRVTIAFDTTIAQPEPILEVLGQILQTAGVEFQDVTVLALSVGCTRLENAIWPGATLAVHDPDDRGQLAYLSATQDGRRIYLNRLLTDADAVIPIGRLGFDPVMGYRGPWSAVFPDSSEREAIDIPRGQFREEADEMTAARAASSLDASLEASWLLGSQFHIGVVPGHSGLFSVVAGREQAVRERGIASVDSAWRFNAEGRAELVVVGIGGPGIPATIDDLVLGLSTARRLVQHGGKIVALSQAQGTIGPAVSRLIDVDEPKQRAAALRGHEGDHDYVTARRLAHVLAWADVFVLSALAPDVVDGLSLITVENADQARRLVGRSGSCTFVSRGELTRAVVREDDEI